MDRTQHVAGTTVIVVAAVVVGMFTLRPPPVPSTPTAGEFSADRALEHVAVIADEPHPMGSPENRDVREYVAGQLRALGLSPELQTVRAPDYYDPAGPLVDVVNVIARIPGTGSSGSTVLMAHYDSVPTTPGANDDAAGVAVVLETARALVASEPLANDVILLLTDGEEPTPRYGASAFVDGHGWMDDVAFVINVEAMGGSGPSLVAQTGKAQAWTMSRLASAAQRPAAFSFITATMELLGEEISDFDPFLAAGTEGIHVAYARGSSLYHTMRDVPEAVEARSVQHHGDYAFGLARELGFVDWSAAPPAGGATFFTAWPGVLVRYGEVWTVPLAVAALVVAFSALVKEVNGRRRLLGRELAGAGSTMLRLVAVALLATLLWMAIAAWRPEMGVGEAYAWLAAFVVGGLGIRIRLRRRAPRAAGIVAVWAVLALATAYGLPGAAYLFTWPAVVAGLVLVFWPEGGAVSRLVRLFLVAGVTALVLVPAIDVFFALAQPRPGNTDSAMTETFAVVALLVGLAVELLAPFATWSTITPDPAPEESAAAAHEAPALAA